MSILSPSSPSSERAGAPAACASRRRPRAEVALHGWEDEDAYLFLDDLGPEDFLGREAPRYGAFDAIWVFTPEIVEPEGRLWIRLAQQGATLVVVVSFHPENFHEEEPP